MKKYRFAFYITTTIVISLFLILLFQQKDLSVLHPKGLIALEEKNLLVLSTLIMLIVVVPVFIFTFVFAWKYRENNPKAKYQPEFTHSVLAEIFWWSIPLLIIGVLSFYTWHYTHKLDPYKPLSYGKEKPLKIQAVALQWKWLFIYPSEGIATLNYMVIPNDTPISIELTADAPMNSFWVPALSGQIFAMPGMRTELHLLANEEGVFSGSSANISGRGFSGMNFKVKSTSMPEFEQFVKQSTASTKILNEKEYTILAKPSEYNPEESYKLDSINLFEQIIMQYMMPSKP